MGIQLNLFGEPSTPPPKKARWNSRLTHWVVIEDGDRGRAVWGIGESRKEALADALHWCRESKLINIDCPEDLQDAVDCGDLHLLRCSRKVNREVWKYGGEIEFKIIGDGIYLPNEKLH